MTIENFLYFVVTYATLFTISFTHLVVSHDKNTQTDEDYEDFPGIEEIEVLGKKTQKSCDLM